MSLKAYIKDTNAMRSIFRQELLTYPNTPEACRPMFAMLASDLSPENLTCDGEAPRAMVTRKARQLWRAWEQLEIIYGAPVKEDEVWGW